MLPEIKYKKYGIERITYMDYLIDKWISPDNNLRNDGCTNKLGANVITEAKQLIGEINQTQFYCSIILEVLKEIKDEDSTYIESKILTLIKILKSQKNVRIHFDLLVRKVKVNKLDATFYKHIMYSINKHRERINTTIKIAFNDSYSICNIYIYNKILELNNESIFEDISNNIDFYNISEESHYDEICSYIEHINEVIASYPDKNFINECENQIKDNIESLKFRNNLIDKAIERERNDKKMNAKRCAYEKLSLRCEDYKNKVTYVDGGIYYRKEILSSMLFAKQGNDSYTYIAIADMYSKLTGKLHFIKSINDNGSYERCQSVMSALNFDEDEAIKLENQINSDLKSRCVAYTLTIKF